MDITIEENVCRLCANRGYNYQSIFDQNMNSIVKKIHNCLPVVIKPTDKLPAHICNPCLGALDISDQLRSQCLIADSILRKQLRVVLTKLIKQEKDPLPDDDETYTLDKISEEFNGSEKQIDPFQVTACIKSEINDGDTEELSENAEMHQVPEGHNELIQNNVFEDTIHIKHESDLNSENILITTENEEKTNTCNETLEDHEDFIQNNIFEDTIHIKHENDLNLENISITTENEENTTTFNNQTMEYHNDSIQNNVLEDAIDIKEENVHGAENESITTEEQEERDTSNNTMEVQEFIEIEEHFDVCQGADWICAGCKHAFDSLDDLLDHKHDAHTTKNVDDEMSTNDSSNFIKDSVVEKSIDIKEHTDIYENSVFTCELCKHEFQSSDDLFGHKKEKHKTRILSEENATNTNNSSNFSEENVEPSSIIKQETNLCKVSDWICEICDDEFKSSDDLLQHKYKEHNNDDDEDSEDVDMNEDSDDSDNSGEDNGVEESIDIKEESLLDSGEASELKKYCYTCNIKITDTKLMELHVKFHEPRAMWCYTCYHTLPSPYDLYIHKKTIHKVSPHSQMKWICEKCDKMIADPKTMKKHMKRCTKEKYKCKYCNQEFFYKKQLVAHQKKSHYNSICDDPTVERFQCEPCDRSFIDRKAYTDHVRWHRRLDTSKYTCSYCDKIFVPGRKLRHHIRRCHEQTKPYKCSECSKEFSNELGLKIHKSTHSRISGRFKIKKNINRIINQNLERREENKFTCSECGECFGSLAILDRHLRQDHNKQIKWFKLGSGMTSSRPEPTKP